VARVKNIEALDAEIAAWTSTLTLEDLEKAVAEADIPSSRIYDTADIAADPQYLERGMVHKVNDPRLGEVLHPGVVPRFEGADSNVSEGGVRWAGPAVGAHTDDVLGKDLGLSADEIAHLKKEGVI